MIRTRVGYTGGDRANPTYHSLGDHTESIQVDYDPDKIGYADLLEVFWKGHRPSRSFWSRQYISAIFYHNAEQHRLALASRQAVEKENGGSVPTEINPLKRFYPAEAYHQKYMLRQNHDLMRIFKAIYPDPRDFMNSTAAARLNGYLGGHGNAADMAALTGKLGIPVAWEQRLAARLKRKSP